MEYFGIRLKEKDKSLKLIREEFAVVNIKPSFSSLLQGLVDRNAYVDTAGSAYREEWCNEYREICLKNYDLNMKYFAMLDIMEFEKSLKSFLKKYKGFKEVADLKEYTGVEGYYMMVLDEYKQVYIGKTGDIKKRIVQHWSRTLPFDRTLCPMYAYDKSCFSIDLFRALDTTRIFIWKRPIVDGIEAELIENFPSQFSTNRMGGDVTNAIEGLATKNERQFK